MGILISTFRSHSLQFITFFRSKSDLLWSTVGWLTASRNGVVFYTLLQINYVISEFSFNCFHDVLSHIYLSRTYSHTASIKSFILSEKTILSPTISSSSWLTVYITLIWLENVLLNQPSWSFSAFSTATNIGIRFSNPIIFVDF